MKWLICLQSISYLPPWKHVEWLDQRNVLSSDDKCELTFTPLPVQQQEQDPTNLYISNLPVSMDEQELESMLKSFGQVISTRILRDANGTSRGVGFARSDFITLTIHRILIKHTTLLWCIMYEKVI